MADPVTGTISAATVATIASLAVSAAGTGVGIAGAEAANSNMNATTEANIQAQEALQKQAIPIYQQNATQSTAPAAQATMNQGQQQALQGYQALANAPTSTQPIVYSQPTAQVSAARQADTARSQQANAALQGIPALQTAWNVGDTTTNAQLGSIGQIGQSIASAFPAQLAAAQQSGAPLQGIGSLLNTAGGIGAQASLAYNNNSNSTQWMNTLKGILNKNNSSEQLPGYNNTTDP